MNIIKQLGKFLGVEYFVSGIKNHNALSTINGIILLVLAFIWISVILVSIKYSIVVSIMLLIFWIFVQVMIRKGVMR